MASPGYETTQDRMAYVVAFLEKHRVPAWAGLAAQARWVGAHGASEDELGFWRTFRHTVATEQHALAGLAAREYERALRAAMQAAFAAQGPAPQGVAVMHWRTGARAMRLSESIQEQIDLVKQSTSTKDQLSHARLALVDLRELFRVVVDAFSPARGANESPAAHQARLAAHYLAKRPEIPTFFNLAWASLPVKKAELRNAMSHGDVRVAADKLEVYDQEDPRAAPILLELEDVAEFIRVAVAAWEAVYCDMLYRYAIVHAGIAAAAQGRDV